MSEATSSTIEFPVSSSRDVLTEILREGAQRMLSTAIEAEVAEWITSHASLVDEQGRLVARASSTCMTLRGEQGSGR